MNITPAAMRFAAYHRSATAEGARNASLGKDTQTFILSLSAIPEEALPSNKGEIKFIAATGDEHTAALKEAVFISKTSPSVVKQFLEMLFRGDFD